MAGRNAGLIEVQEFKMTEVQLRVVGLTPYICNRMSEKVKRTLIFPEGRKTAAAKAANLKHNPLQEFRDSFYRAESDEGPTLIQAMASSFKGAIMTAALDTPGAAKAQVGRLAWVVGHMVPLYGIPQVFLSVTRSADMNKTPDVRTRAILPRWASLLTIRFTSPLNETAIINLLHRAGNICGVGDWRPEKGKGAFGQFRVCMEDDNEFAEIASAGGHEAQLAASLDPAPYDSESAEILTWFHEEVKRRGKSEAAN